MISIFFPILRNTEDGTSSTGSIIGLFIRLSFQIAKTLQALPHGREEGLAVGLREKMGHRREKVRRHLVNTSHLLGVGLAHSQNHPI